MKRLLMVLLMILSMQVYFCSTVFGEIDSNIDGGDGSGTGTGTGSSYWTNGGFGIRVTLVNRYTDQPLSNTTIDYSDRILPTKVYHFGETSKLHYFAGASLRLRSSLYQKFDPVGTLPDTFYSDDGHYSLTALKNYLVSTSFTDMYANDLGVSTSTITDGTYQVLVEPVVYFVYKGDFYAMTPTELAIFDYLQKGAVKKVLESVTHVNAPMGMYLERGDLGVAAKPSWLTAAKLRNTYTWEQADHYIYDYLGLGIVTYTTPTDSGETDLYYRRDRDVITVADLSSTVDILPSAPATVTFKLGSTTLCTKSVIVPEGEKQRVWCKWHTPRPGAQKLTMTLEASEGVLSVAKYDIWIYAAIQEPPDPTATDRDDYFQAIDPPTPTNVTTRSWWLWTYDGAWSKETYTATLQATIAVSPSNHVPTKKWLADEELWQMKSGYGLHSDVVATIGNTGTADMIAGPQTVETSYPEFYYDAHRRWGELISHQGNRYTFAYPENIYSTYRDRVHFTPVWYPNGEYNVRTQLMDFWTPAGMLQMSDDTVIKIRGSVFDDWQVKPYQE